MQSLTFGPTSGPISPGVELNPKLTEIELVGNSPIIAPFAPNGRNDAKLSWPVPETLANEETRKEPYSAC